MFHILLFLFLYIVFLVNVFKRCLMSYDKLYVYILNQFNSLIHQSLHKYNFPIFKMDKVLSNFNWIVNLGINYAKFVDPNMIDFYCVVDKFSRSNQNVFSHCLQIIWSEKLIHSLSWVNRYLKLLNVSMFHYYRSFFCIKKCMKYQVERILKNYFFIAKTLQIT